MTQPPSDRGAIGWRGLLLVGALLAALLVATSGRYGYHRDELYFIWIGEHPAWGYVDQPPLVPLLAHAADAASGGSLVGLRVLTSLASAATAVLTGLVARELGASRAAQVLAASAWAISAIAMAAGHLMTTTSFDLLAWAALGLAGVRALRIGEHAWLWVGLVAGIGLEVKTLIAFGLAALFLGILVAGPREVLRSGWVWLAAVLMVALWAPNLLWQAMQDWPQLEMSSRIASGHSGTSEPRALFVPFQVVLLSPVLVPVWALGWWRLLRAPELARWRCFAVAYVVLALLFIVTGGKPYYLCGMYPVLLAAGAGPVADWALRRRQRVVLLGAGLAVGLAMNVFLMLPVLPADRLADTPVPEINYDAGEQIGWTAFAASIESVVSSVAEERPDRDRVVVLAGNYGEAGALHRYAPDLFVVSGHNSLHALGPPAEDRDVVVAIGYPVSSLRGWFGRVEQVATTPTPVRVENDEAERPVYLCHDPLQSWAELWPSMSQLG